MYACDTVKEQISLFFITHHYLNEIIWSKQHTRGKKGDEDKLRDHYFKFCVLGMRMHDNHLPSTSVRI